MNLWDLVTVCLVLLNSISTFPLPAANILVDYPSQLEDVMDFIQTTLKRLKRSPDKPRFSRRERNRQNAGRNNNSNNRKGRRAQRLKSRDCVLSEIHLNVTDLGLGYTTKEELIFRYCSGSCETAVTLYDQILNNLTQNKKLVSDKIRPQPCCRPIAYDDDVSFLDDDLSTYHILRKHSAKKCGCV
ncbi:glial cell line-derived neurotrophic factor isoform X2 [Pseudonaja textilis]|uniref:glial cell line-derived neurotrophic factor isoform X2 n=1 Tax=Pseudonaja textilis TaxID=8673 RepID=UPI000EA927BB|nr:glial cell line-derived neurotrophic factor isoform X2 [Pseudonaja textilis]